MAWAFCRLRVCIHETTKLQQVMHNTFEELLKQLRSDPNNPELKEKTQNWLRLHPESEDEHELWKNHWQQTGTHLSEADHQRLEKLLVRIHVKANIPASQQAPGRKKHKLIPLAKIAASLLVPAILFSALYFYHHQNSNVSDKLSFITAEADTTMEHLLLPDSTEVWLNSKSQLRYSPDLAKSKQRLVSLSGQAYFKVHHDALHPFIVQTTQTDIRVLGTSFDVSAYPDDKMIYSTLEEGSIAVLNKQGTQLTKLTPGEQATFDRRHSTLSKSKVKTTDFTAWKTGKLIFKDCSIADVARKLERRYDCTITISEQLLQENPTYTFSIQNENLPEICKLIELSTQARATRNGKQIHFEKAK
jgi:ferric-dicitrate binding protein FerR (iron transport regulator)